MNLGSAFAPTVMTQVLVNFNEDPTTAIRATDIDGDGAVQLLVPNDSQDKHEQLQYDGTLSRSEAYLNLPFLRLPENQSRRNLHFADINGDGLQDAIYPLSGLTAQLNSGRGFSHLLPEALQYAIPSPPSNLVFDAAVRIVDFNGDGSDDVLISHPGAASDDDDFHHGLQLYTWRNNRFVRIPLRRSISSVLPQIFQPLDFDGDGAVDLSRPHLDPFDPRFFLLKRLGGVPDRVVRVKVGTLGPRVEVDYTTLADATTHTPGICTFPLICPRRGGSLVSRHRLANGLSIGSPWRQFSHHYTAARIDPEGRGWLGFETHQIIDEERPGATTTLTFDNDARLDFETTDGSAHTYPLVNLPTKISYEVDVQPPLDVDYKSVLNKRYNFGPGTVAGTYVVEPLTWESGSDSERRDGGAWVELHSTSSTFLYDEFGNMRQATTVVPGSDQVEFLTYDNDQTNWLIGKLETRTATSCTRPEAVCETRESALEYESNGNVRAVTIEPNDDELLLRTAVTYGSFGNIASITMSDADGQTRSTSLTYDSLSTYPATATNALGHRVQVTVHSGLGVPISRLDSNDVPSTMKYDRFGRIREVNYADGYFERIDATSPLIYQTSVPSGNPGTTIVAETVLLDVLGRQIEHRIPAFNGGVSVTRATFDRLGRVSTTM